jgi:hypothetical protein
MSQPEFERRYGKPRRPGRDVITVLTCLVCERQFPHECTCEGDVVPEPLPVLYTRVVGTAAVAEYDRSRWERKQA